MKELKEENERISKEKEEEIRRQKEKEIEEKARLASLKSQIEEIGSKLLQLEVPLPVEWKSWDTTTPFVAKFTISGAKAQRSAVDSNLYQVVRPPPRSRHPLR